MAQLFEKYMELGDRYKKNNVNQAYLCYENALFFIYKIWFK